MHAPQETHSLSLTIANGAGGRDRVMRQKRQRAAGGSIRLADRFRYVLGIMRGPAQVHAFRAEIHRPQFDVGFLEESVRVQSYFEQSPLFPCWSCGRNDCGGQSDRIGIDDQAPCLK